MRGDARTIIDVVRLKIRQLADSEMFHNSDFQLNKQFQRLPVNEVHLCNKSLSFLCSNGRLIYCRLGLLTNLGFAITYFE